MPNLVLCLAKSVDDDLTGFRGYPYPMVPTVPVKLSSISYLLLNSFLHALICILLMMDTHAAARKSLFWS
jgi:hypothetical protein